MPYYIISLKHTSPKDKFFMLWRPGNVGYAFHKDQAGVYYELRPGYHDSENCLPITEEEADKLFKKFEQDILMPNTLKIRNQLGLEIFKGRIQKKQLSLDQNAK